MKYENAKDVLPPELLAEVQKVSHSDDDIISYNGTMYIGSMSDGNVVSDDAF